MKKNYLYLFLLLLLSNFCWGQDCTVQKTVSDPTICIGDNATITLSASESGVSYQLRKATTNIDVGTAQIGDGNDLHFIVSPGTTTTYYILAYLDPITYPTTSCSTVLTDQSIVTVTSLPSIALTSANATQTSCQNTAIANITYNVTDATDASVSGLPTGLTGNYADGVFTISGTPTVAGTFNFTVTTSGGCPPADTASGTITVMPLSNIALSSANAMQTICQSTPIANITYSVTDATDASVSGLPAGVTGNYTDGVFTISGTPTVSGTFNFTVTTLDGCAPDATASGTITVMPLSNIALTSANATQTCCQNMAIADITYNVTDATNATVSGLPAGVTGNYVAGVFTIGGTPTASGTFNFMVTTSGGCAPDATASGTITVTPLSNIALTSANATQTRCQNVAIDNITYNITNAANATVSGLPAGVTGNYVAGVFTISGTPTAAGTFNFTVTTLGGCAPDATASGTITVNPTPNALASNTSQTICSGTAIATILLSGNVASTIFNWTRDNSVDVTGIAVNGSGDISGILTNTTNSPVTVTFTITPTTASGCYGASITATVLVQPATKGGVVTISQPNSPIVRTATECHTATGTLYLSGYIGNVVRWESSSDAGSTWTPIANTTATYNYNGLKQTAMFRAVLKNEPDCLLAYSASSMINVIPNLKPSPVAATPQTICSGDSSTLSSSSSYATSSLLATGGTFSAANPPGWKVDNCSDCLSSGGSNSNLGPWQLSSSNGKRYSGVDYSSDGKFAIAHGEITSYMYTPIFSTFGLSNATLTFKHAYKFLADARGEIQISVNGGITYTTIKTYTGSLTPTDPFTAAANSVTIDLNTYLGQGNLKIRFYYHGLDTVSGNANGSSWAIDDIAIPDVPTNLNTQWVDAVTGQIISTSMTMTVSPTQTTTYAITSYLNGCNSFGTEGTAYVTITVNPRPTAVISQNQTVCNGGTATFSIALTGTPPWTLTYSDGTNYITPAPISTSPYTFSVDNMTVNKTYTITALSDSKCTAKPSDRAGSVTVTVLNGTAGLWTGLVSTDWFDCKNWAGGLPSATIDAVIPNGVARMPVIDPLLSRYTTPPYNPNAIASARDVIINTGASITMNANSNLQVKRDWKNSGSFIPGTGTVTFNGDVTNQVHLVNSGIKLNEGFYNLTLDCTNGAKGINLADAFQLTVANNLVLTSGDLRLTGEAQLVQTGTSANPVGGTGVLLRDQQGTKSSYHYNYWSSPVSSDNLNYTVGGVLKDGTDAATRPFSQDPINFGWGYDFSDGSLTKPIKISNRWLHKYTQISTTYSSWQLIESTGSVKVGEGFTMKGVTGLEPVTNYQNYVFAGKPNNGDINLTIAQNQVYLIGNPYPSAMDAREFIKDNIQQNGRAVANVFNGALYFWDHFGATTHYLGQYVGGYATYNLTGGVVAVSSSTMINNNMAEGTKIPTQYIPVAQGFLVRTDLAGKGGITSPINGGTIRFKNSQRVFKTESPSNSIFIRNENQTVGSNNDNRQKIRLSFEAPSGLHRQLLVGADPQATNLFDMGYDAPMIDLNSDDLYWNFSDGKFVIQAVSDFNIDQVIPLGIKVSTAGATKIKIDELENIPTSTEIYLFDSVTGLYHDIKNEAFVAEFPIGEYPDRFTLRFAAETLSNDEMDMTNGVMVFADANHMLNIKNNLMDTRVEVVQLHNILGQSITKWDVADEDQRNIKIPVDHIRTGTYIVKLKTSNGSLSKKVIIR